MSKKAAIERPPESSKPRPAHSEVADQGGSLKFGRNDHSRLAAQLPIRSSLWL